MDPKPTDQKKQERLIMHRHGRIETTLKSANQCKDVGHPTYDYTVSITCFNKLNPQGYLIDNRTINHIMRDSLQEMTSCEGLCLFFANKLEEAFRQAGVPVCEMHIELVPAIDGAEYKDFAAFELSRIYNLTTA